MYDLLEMLYENCCAVPDVLRQKKMIESDYFKLTIFRW